MFNRGNPLYDNLSDEERKELTSLNNGLDKYIIDLDRQRKKLKEEKIPKDEIDSRVNHSLRPSEEDFLRRDILNQKIWLS